LLKEAWTLAIESLSWIELKGLSERLALARASKQLEIKDPDALKLAYKLVCETLRRKNLIDRFINKVLAPVSLGNYNLGVRAFLRLYVYQTRIEAKSGKIDVDGASRIVGTVRSILGWKELHPVEEYLGLLLTCPMEIAYENLTDEEKLGLSTFNPTWFVKYCLKLLGRAEALKLLETTTKTPPTYIRINTLNSTEEKIIKKLEAERVKVQKVEDLKHAYKVLKTEKPLVKTTSFREGLFYIQDKASCFAVEAADPKPGMTVIDVCAAPGAKTTYMSQLMKNKGQILSIDYSTRRMKVWKEETARMGTKNANPIIADACNPLPFKIKANLLFLDPPCTSTGAFGKMPSAKWRVSRRSVDKMAEIQWKMLQNCAQLVKKGGSLVYSTCSVTVEENEMLIERFLKHYPDFVLAEITPPLGSPGFRGLTTCKRLYPHLHECNGFFIAKLEKKE